MLQRALIFLLLLHGVNARNDPIPTLHRVYRKDDPRLICDSGACSKLGTITCFGVPSSLSPLHYNTFWWRCRLNDVRSHIVEIRMEDDLDTLHVHLTPRREQNIFMDAIHLTWVLAMTYQFPQLVFGVALGQWAIWDSTPRQIERSYWN